MIGSSTRGNQTGISTLLFCYRRIYRHLTPMAILFAFVPTARTLSCPEILCPGQKAMTRLISNLFHRHFPRQLPLLSSLCLLPHKLVSPVSAAPRRYANFSSAVCGRYGLSTSPHAMLSTLSMSVMIYLYFRVSLPGTLTIPRSMDRLNALC